MMLWYQKYVDDAQWHQFYKDEAWRKLGSFISDWENCFGEARTKLLVDTLPNVTLAHDGNHDGYVASVYRRILEDLRRKYCGRPRPPAKMNAVGPPITLIYTLHCLDKLEISEISGRLDIPKVEVKKWALWLTVERKCPETITMVSTSQSSDDSDYTMQLRATDSDDPVGDEQIGLETEAVLDMVVDFGRPNTDLFDQLSKKTKDALEGLSQLIDLSDENRLLLRLRYVEGLSKSKSAKQMRMATSTLEKRERELLDHLKDTLTSAGFGI